MPNPQRNARVDSARKGRAVVINTRHNEIHTPLRASYWLQLGRTQGRYSKGVPVETKIAWSLNRFGYAASPRMGPQLQQYRPHPTHAERNTGSKRMLSVCVCALCCAGLPHFRVLRKPRTSSPFLPAHQERIYTLVLLVKHGIYHRTKSTPYSTGHGTSMDL